MNLFTLIKSTCKKIIIYLLYFFNSLNAFINIVYFLIKNKKIFKYKNVLILYHWAFGHQVLMADYLARYCLDNNIKYIAIQICDINRTNPYLAFVYKNYYETIVLRNSNNIRTNKLYYKILKLIFRIINIFKKINLLNYSKFYMDNFHKYKVDAEILNYDENLKLIEKHKNHNYWMSLFDKEYNNLNHSCEYFEKKCENFLRNINVDINKKIVNIFFREEVTVDGYFDKVRSIYEPKNYLKTIKWLEKNDYNIFIYCDDRVFNELKDNTFTSTYFLQNFKNKIDVNFLNIYLYLKSSLHICQNSGSHILAFALNTEIIMVDCFPLGEGIPKGNILCPKILKDNKVLNFKEYSKTNLIYGEGIDFNKTKIIPNNEDEILEIVTKKYEKLVQVNNLIPDNCLAKHRDNLIYASN